MAYKSATKEQRELQVQEIIAMVKAKGRVTTAQAMEHFGLCDYTIRRRFDEACATGEVISHFKCGLFRDEKALADYFSERPRRLYGQARDRAESRALECSGNDIFDECRQNWQGYRIHKIFGSARA